MNFPMVAEKRRPIKRGDAFKASFMLLYYGVLLGNISQQLA